MGSWVLSPAKGSAADRCGSVAPEQLKSTNKQGNRRAVNAKSAGNSGFFICSSPRYHESVMHGPAGSARTAILWIVKPSREASMLRRHVLQAVAVVLIPALVLSCAPTHIPPVSAAGSEYAPDRDEVDLWERARV